MTQEDGSRLRKFLKHLVVITITLIGVLSGAAALFQFIPWQIWTVVLGVCVMVASLLLWKATKPVHLPEETIVESENKDGAVCLEVPMPHHMLLAANKHADGNLW